MPIQIYTANGMKVDHTSFKFSGGEVQVRVKGWERIPWYTIYALVTSSDELMELFLLTDALRRYTHNRAHIHLNLPYVPYARQDRVCAQGEALSLSVITKLINAQEYDSVTIQDPHNELITGMIDRCSVTEAWEILGNVMQHMTSRVILVAPDAGALKKVKKCADSHACHMVRADKSRNPETGELNGAIVYSEHVGKSHFLIVDDICDGGRSFIELGEVLKSLTDSTVNLYVTHGIFSKGLDVFNDLIDNIYVANPFPNAVKTPKTDFNQHVLHIDVKTRKETWL